MEENREYKEETEEPLYPGEEKLLKKLEKKRDEYKNKARQKEVRKALLGNLVLGEDDRLKPSEGLNMDWYGTADGSFGTRLFGIAKREVPFTADPKLRTQALYQAQKVMEGIGRGLSFETVPEGSACLMKHLFFRPVVLIFEPKQTPVKKAAAKTAEAEDAGEAKKTAENTGEAEEPGKTEGTGKAKKAAAKTAPETTAEGLVLTAYCGRDILTISSLRRAIRLFTTAMPDKFKGEETLKNKEVRGRITT